MSRWRGKSGSRRARRSGHSLGCIHVLPRTASPWCGSPDLHLTVCISRSQAGPPVVRHRSSFGHRGCSRGRLLAGQSCPVASFLTSEGALSPAPPERCLQDGVLPMARARPPTSRLLATGAPLPPALWSLASLLLLPLLSLVEVRCLNSTCSRSEEEASHLKSPPWSRVGEWEAFRAGDLAPGCGQPGSPLWT